MAGNLQIKSLRKYKWQADDSSHPLGSIGRRHEAPRTRDSSSRRLAVRKVMVDVETFVTWCRVRGRRVDSAARADYVIALLKIADDSR
jgi:hypothetical protein